jgi:hypothetical protein
LEAPGRLAGASLLTFSVDDIRVSAHRLTMRVARERLAHDSTLASAAAATAELLSVVTESLTEPWQDRPAARDAIEQVMALYEDLAPWSGRADAALTEIVLELRVWAVWCLNELGHSFAQAISYGQAVLAEAERVLGDTHPDTLNSRNNLAAAYQDAGRLEEAENLRRSTG